MPNNPLKPKQAPQDQKKPITQNMKRELKLLQRDFFLFTGVFFEAKGNKSGTLSSWSTYRKEATGLLWKGRSPKFFFFLWVKAGKTQRFQALVEVGIPI
mgnify:CR=1 FL=1